MRTPVNITPTVHTEGGEFRLDIVDDANTPDSRRWRIVLREGALHVVLLDEGGFNYNVLRVTRHGTAYDIVRGGPQP